MQPCPVHPPQAWKDSTRRRRLPPNWSSQIVPRILARDPVCKSGETCDGLALSREVDHIGDPDDHSDRNLQGLCVNCHKAKTAREAAEARRNRAR